MSVVNMKLEKIKSFIKRKHFDICALVITISSFYMFLSGLFGNYTVLSWWKQLILGWAGLVIMVKISTILYGKK